MSSREGERAMALDPQAQEVINLVIKSGRPAYNTLSPKDARQLFRETRPASTPTPAEIGAVKNLTADGPGGPIPLRVYRPADVPAGTPLPVLVYYHGGGWVIGDLDTHDVQCRQITAEAGITVVAVDYRLAPEHKFPAAVDDAWAATRWVVARAVAGGSSAGARHHRGVRPAARRGRGLRGAALGRGRPGRLRQLWRNDPRLHADGAAHRDRQPRDLPRRGLPPPGAALMREGVQRS